MCFPGVGFTNSFLNTAPFYSFLPVLGDKREGRRKMIGYDAVSFNYVFLTWRNLSWFSGDHPVTLGITTHGGYCLIFMDSRCPEVSWF